MILGKIRVVSPSPSSRSVFSMLSAGTEVAGNPIRLQCFPEVATEGIRVLGTVGYRAGSQPGYL